MKSLLKKAILLSLTSIALISCGTAYNNDVEVANRFVQDLGGSYYVAKGQTAQPGYAVIKHNGAYFAIDLTYYYSNATEYMNDQALMGRLYGNLNYDNAGSYYDPRTGLTFDETSESSKDLEKAKGFIEQIRLETVTEKLVSEFGLSEDRGLAVAKLVNNYELVKSQRALTSADANAFAKGVLGVSIKEAQAAYAKVAQGENTDYKQLIERSSSFNGVTPEHMNDLITKFFAQN